jgi:hypothetical protein
VHAPKATLFRLATEAEIGVHRPNEPHPFSLLWLDADSMNVLCEHPQMREFDGWAIEWLYRNVHQKHRLKVFAFWMVTKLFTASRDFNELSLKGLKLLTIVPRVPPTIRWDGREVAHGYVASTFLLYWRSLLVNLGRIAS